MTNDTLGPPAAKDFIVSRVERLHWRIWNGKTKNAHVTIDRTRAVMHVFPIETSRRGMGTSSGRLWHVLREIDEYLTGQTTWLVNDAKRYRAGLRVGTSITEGTANFLAKRRMNKRQRMRLSRRGADAALQVRCAIYMARPDADLAICSIPGANQLNNFRWRPDPPGLWTVPTGSEGRLRRQSCDLRNRSKCLRARCTTNARRHRFPTRASGALRTLEAA